MASEKYANDAFTTLNGGINNSTTTVVVTDASLFPATGQFRIKVDSEIMLVTSVSSNTFTVATRGQEGTSANSHSDLADVTHILTKGALNQIIADNVQSVAYASLPSAEKAGRLALTTDSVHMFRDNGSTLDAFALTRHVIPPLSSAFTWDNQSTASVADNVGTIFLSGPCNVSNSLSGMYKSATAPYTITARIRPHIAPQNYSGYCLFFRESSSGKMVNCGWMYLNAWIFCIRKWTTSTSYSADYTFISGTPMEWIRIQDDNTNRKYSISADGINWIEKLSHTRTDFMTANQVGFALIPEKQTGLTTLTQGFSILSWEQT